MHSMARVTLPLSFHLVGDLPFTGCDDCECHRITSHRIAPSCFEACKWTRRRRRVECGLPRVFPLITCFAREKQPPVGNSVHYALCANSAVRGCIARCAAVNSIAVETSGNRWYRCPVDDQPA